MSRKRPRPADTIELDEPDLGGGLYDFLPKPDPMKELAAVVRAESKAPAKLPLPEEDPTRVIFLDIDGVLLRAGEAEMVMVDGELVPIMAQTLEADADFRVEALNALRTIVQQTGASIVLSSEWRKTPARKESIGLTFRARGLPQLRDATITSLKVRDELLRGDNAIAWCERRAREIGDWLKRNPKVKSWVALDDVDFSWADSCRLKSTPLIKYRSVKTHPEVCLTERDAKEAIQMLLHPTVLTPEQEAAAERRAVRKTQAAIAAAKARRKE
eukprot:TRINITY_DN28500_c0_g1_i1.p1 TRINITY_DN28500_c0_g1~~TRINITY_DN28500_c0_g1_i1.p1  ORF type:complete len:293 (-),score=52.25 TRINITY_DN28500_c0_g1_i1:204-1019(-)